MDEPWLIEEGDDPVVATAIHNGHGIRSNLVSQLALDEPGRLREEDPFTAAWAQVANTRVSVYRSRFEVDLNRPRERAVYRVPQDAWGLRVWKDPLPQSLVDQSLALYDRFYADLQALFSRKRDRFGKFLVLDLHSYNHKRGGPDAAPAAPADNPEVNVGTRTMDRRLWGPVVDCFVRTLGACRVDGRPLDVRENVKFFGGNMAEWTHRTFPASACVLSVEFKKVFMDEWTGRLD